MPARTATRILRRHRVPVPAACDPVTGHQNRATRHSDRRYEHPEPDAMIHLDVKKLGRTPDGGGRRVHGRSEAVRGRSIGYDHVHTAIDDHTHLAYAQVLPDEKSTTCAAFPTRAAASFTAHGITRIHRVPTDNPRNPRNHRHPAAFQQACTELGTRQKFTRPRYPNPAVRGPHGKVERLNRTPATERASQRPHTNNDQPTRALAAWLKHYNTQHPHSAPDGKPPITRLPPRS